MEPLTAKALQHAVLASMATVMDPNNEPDSGESAGSTTSTPDSADCTVAMRSELIPRPTISASLFITPICSYGCVLPPMNHVNTLKGAPVHHLVAVGNKLRIFNKAAKCVAQDLIDHTAGSYP